MTDIVMPRLSDTMEEGTILRWLKQDGEHVERGEELVEIETDKANMTYESDRAGTLQIVAREGDTLAVGEPIAHIGEAAGEPQPAATDQAANAPPTPASTPFGNGAPPERARAESRAAEPSASRVKASPLARRIARDTGVDLRSLTGSGPGGRIVKADVQGSAGVPAQPTAPPTPSQPTAPEAPSPPTAPPTPSQPTAPPTSPPTAPEAPSPPVAPEDVRAGPAVPTPGELAGAKGETSVVELSRTQRTIARRMAESKATIPHFTLSADVDMQRCVELRAELKRLAQAPSGDGARTPTYNDMLVKACALALREHPRANGSYRDGRFELHSRVNVGLAVAVDADDPLHSALVVPTIFDADSKSLGEIARETRTLAGRVRDGSITPPELSGGTFTVSNLGMYGVSSFTAIVNPPQAAILAVGAVQPRALAVPAEASDGHDGGEARGEAPGTRLAVRHAMTITLSCDHRILYGADATLFLARIRDLLQEPASLTL